MFYRLRSVPGIGKVMAGRLVERFGLETLEVIEKQPDLLPEVPGIGPQRAGQIQQAWKKQKGIRETLVFLQSHGIEAHPVLIRRASHGPLQPKYRGEAQFNHVVVRARIDGQVTWLDVAESGCPFGLLPPDAPGDFNQALLNIIVNAAHAIGEMYVQNGSSEKGTITVSTQQVNGFAEIRIKDTGPGIAKEIQKKIFDPFFTTKEVGQGTGQGLAIAHSTIVNKLGGKLKVMSEKGGER